MVFFTLNLSIELFPYASFPQSSSIVDQIAARVLALRKRNNWKKVYTLLQCKAMHVGHYEELPLVVNIGRFGREVVAAPLLCCLYA